MTENITHRVQNYWTVRTHDFSTVRKNELQRESDEITLSMPASLHKRPAWDRELAEAAGFSECGEDEAAGRRILRQNDLCDAPLFLFWAKK